MSMDRRKDSNFFVELFVATTNFADSRAAWNFASQGIVLAVISDEVTDIIEYSFDGVNLHGNLRPMTVVEGIVFDNRPQNKVWFRRKTPGLPVTIRVEAWRSES